MAAPWPLLIGIAYIQDRRSLTESSDKRLRIAAYARDEGYSVVAVFEVSGIPIADEPIYVSAGELAERSGAKGIVTCGAGVDMDRVRQIGERAAMTVIELPLDVPVFGRRGWPPDRRGPH